MIIKSIEMCNFRNYKLEEFIFHEGTNVLYGDNAQGKTNVLEAIFVGGTTKSHKGSKDNELINYDEDNSHIRIFVNKNEIEYKVEIHLKRSKKKGIAIDGLPIKTSSELMGLINIVFFSPEDLSIIKDGPEERRRFINMELCQLDKRYLYYLTKYKKCLKQRNALLKQIKDNESLKESLDIWDASLIENGKNIISIREEFVNKLAAIVKEKHKKLTGEKEQIEVIYKPNVKASDYEMKILMERERDIYLGTTTVGPHRDDIAFTNNKKDIKTYGSQGQKRTTALSLKMAEIQLVEEITGQKPILLLDDVLSELDRKRQNFLLENIKGIQTIITCTGLEEFVENKINIDKTFHIINGGIAWANQRM